MSLAFVWLQAPACPVLAGALVGSTDTADLPAADGGRMSRPFKTVYLRTPSHAEGESEGKAPLDRPRVRVIQDLGRPGKHPLDWRANTTNPISLAERNISDTDPAPNEGVGREQDNAQDDLPKGKVSDMKRDRGRPRRHPLNFDCHVSVKQIPPTLSQKPVPVQSIEHRPKEVAGQPRAARTITVQVLREEPPAARSVSQESEAAELIPEELEDRLAGAANDQDKIGNFEINNAKPAAKIIGSRPEYEDSKESPEWGPASPPGLDITKGILFNFIGESASKRQELAKLKASYVRISRQVQFWQENPDWAEPTIPEEGLDGSSTPGRLLALREFVSTRKEEPDDVMPADALVAMHPRQAWKAVTDLRLQLLRLKMELLYSRIQVKFRDLRLLELSAKHRRLKTESSQKERKWKRSDAYKDQLIEKLDRRLEVFTEGTLDEKEEAEKQKRKWEILWKKLEKIFTPVQLTRLRTGKRRKWAEEDVRRAIELRKRVTRRGYAYIRRVMKIPLPGVVVLQRASMRFPDLRDKYEQMVAANLLTHCTKKKSAGGNDPMLGVGDAFPMASDEAADVLRTPQSGDLLQPAPLLPVDRSLYRSLHMPLDVPRHPTPHRPPSDSPGRPPPAKRRKKAAPPDSVPFGLQLARPDTGDPAPRRSAPARRGRPRGRGAAAAARRDRVDWDAADLLWDDMRSADNAALGRKISWTPGRIGSR